MESRFQDLTILHFNDAYDIAEQENEPVGGIARFKTALTNFSQFDPINSI